jgi:hypothetical protein
MDGMDRRRLERLQVGLRTPHRTELGVGPMSVAGIDATIELANELAIPLMLIASRRQIECAEQGSGYVNNWSTEQFAAYVRERDRGGYVLLCRDHGGPWQNYPEVQKKLPLQEAMESAKRSFAVDLASGFDVIHIDPSIPPAGAPHEKPNVLELLCELYEFVVEHAAKLGQPILIEVGTEEQNGGLNTPEDLDRFLQSLADFTGRRGFQMPIFVVAQTGTLVRETSNVGLVAKVDRAGQKRLTEDVSKLVTAAEKHGVFIKEHNGDYLPEEVLALRPQMRVGATNIAPEYGVAETRYLLESSQRLGLRDDVNAFLGLSLSSRKWEKWLLPNTTATDRDKAIMAGHYVFATSDFKAIYQRMRDAHERAGIDLDRALRDHLKRAILRTARPMGLA